MTTIDDLGEVMKPVGDCSVVNAQDSQLDRYNACMICKARVEPTILPLGECTKCGTMQRIKLCNEQLSASWTSVLVLKILLFMLLKSLVEEFCWLRQGGAVTTDALLSAPVTNRLIFNLSKIITGVARG